VFVLRQARPEDLDALEALAKHLNTLNLPPDRAYLRDLLEGSQRAFEETASRGDFDATRRYLFVLAELDGTVIGTSMIHAQHGTPAEPHVFFHIDRDERYASVEIAGERREIHMDHAMLRLGLTYQGPTEIGGLVLDPTYRGRPGKLGRLLSLGRFSYIARHRNSFRERVLAELLPPLYKSPDGDTSSPLWDALGSRLTGLTYAEADALSRSDKGFIWDLFPQTPIHTAFLPAGVRRIIGRVGKQTEGAQRLLAQIGFSDSGKVDPFDGGPHYEARVDELTPIRDGREYLPVVSELSTETLGAIVSYESEATGFRAVWSAVEPVGGAFDDEGHLTQVRVRQNVLEHLGMPNDGEAKLHVALRPERRLAEMPTRAAGG
jgi:arginine N-succinyltransferase